MDAIVAVIVIGVTLLPTGDPSDHRAVPSPLMHAPWLVVFPLAAVAVLLFRRRRPTAVLAGTVAVLIVGVIVDRELLPLIVPVVIATFGLALRASRRTTLIAIPVTVVVLLIVEVVVSRVHVLDVRVLPITTVVAAAAIAGDATRSRRAYISAITERALRAEETRESEARRRVVEERLRIARDLHDTVAHQITVINLHANVAIQSVRADPALAEQSLTTISTAARTVLTEIADLLSLLRADAGAEGLPATPSVSMSDVDALLAGFAASGLAVTSRTEGTAGLPESVSGVAYRVVQEALTNAHKHGSEGRAHLLIEYTPELLTITVTNPAASAPAAVGSAASGPAASGPAASGPAAPGDDLPRSGHGLQGVRERVGTVGGRVEAGPTATGFVLRAFLPLTASTVAGGA